MKCYECGDHLATDEDGNKYCPSATYCSGCGCQMHEGVTYATKDPTVGSDESNPLRCTWCREVYCEECFLEHPPKCKDREEEDPLCS